MSNFLSSTLVCSMMSKSVWKTAMSQMHLTTSPADSNLQMQFLISGCLRAPPLFCLPNLFSTLHTFLSAPFRKSKWYDILECPLPCILSELLQFNVLSHPQRGSLCFNLPFDTKDNRCFSSMHLFSINKSSIYLMYCFDTH